MSPIAEYSSDVNSELRSKALVIIQHYKKIKEEWDSYCCCGKTNETQLKANIFFKFVTDRSCLPVPYDEIISAGGSVMNRSSFKSSVAGLSFSSSLRSVND